MAADRFDTADFRSDLRGARAAQIGLRQIHPGFRLRALSAQLRASPAVVAPIRQAGLIRVEGSVIHAAFSW